MQAPTHSNFGERNESPGKTTGFPLRRPLPVVFLPSVILAIIASLSAAGCGGGGGGSNGGGNTTPTPTPSATATPTPTPTGTATPTPSPSASPSATVPVIVPGTVTVNVGETSPFTASVPVNWSVQEAGSSGTIAADGTYSAPAMPGTYHIIATSQSDSSRTASATVIVQAGNATGVIQ